MVQYFYLIEHRKLVCGSGSGSGGNVVMVDNIIVCGVELDLDPSIRRN